MNKKIKSFGVIAILIIAGLVVLQLPASSAEVEAPFGEWQVLVGITDTDGRYIPMEIETFGNQMLNVFIGGTQISSVTYTLKAKATGSGYDTCEVDFGSAFIAAKVCLDAPYIDCNYKDAISGGVTTLTVGDSEFVTVFEYTLTTANIEVYKPAGTYIVSFFLVSGGAYYRGLPDGDWEYTTSIPGASTTVVVTNEHYCYQCDGEGGINSYQTSDPGCPSGWFETISVSECECYTDTSYGSWSSWSNIGCSGDCYMQQQRTRTIYEGEYCPGMSGEPDWVAVGTDTDYQTVYDSDCCDTTYVTCYQCDGNGGVDSQQFEGSCGSGWYSSPPSCSCYTESSYGSWGSWQFMYCMGYIVYERRARDVLERECCPGGGCDAWVTVGTNWHYRNYVDITQCPGGCQIVSSNMFYTVGSTPEFTPYYVDAEHYLGVARIST